MKPETPASNALAIHQSLEYLYREALATDMHLVAHLIGAASEAAKQFAESRAGTNVVPFTPRQLEA